MIRQVKSIMEDKAKAICDMLVEKNMLSKDHYTEAHVAILETLHIGGHYQLLQTDESHIIAKTILRDEESGKIVGMQG